MEKTKQMSLNSEDRLIVSLPCVGHRLGITIGRPENDDSPVMIIIGETSGGTDPIHMVGSSRVVEPRLRTP